MHLRWCFILFSENVEIGHQNQSLSHISFYLNLNIYTCRSKLENATIDTQYLNNTGGLKPSNSSKSGGRAVEILSEPVDISTIDAAADEIAELVSNHTFNFRMEDTFNSTVVSFKPVVGTISSSN